MLTETLGWMIKSKFIKLGGGILGGTGALTLIFGLHGNVVGQIDKAEARSKEYVGLKLGPFETEIKNLKKDVKETKDMVKDIHIYLIQKGDK